MSLIPPPKALQGDEFGHVGQGFGGKDRVLGLDLSFGAEIGHFEA